MEELLKKYIEKECNLKEVIIDYYNIEGVECKVKFYVDNSDVLLYGTLYINIWDMLIFLNVLKTN